MSFIKDIIAILAPIAAGYLGIRFGIRQFREQKKINLIEEQLNKFYSPLLGIRKEIQGKSELRLKIKKADDKTWERVAGNPSEVDIRSIDKGINYNTTQWQTELFPLYIKMLDIFRENYWLAEPETQKYYQHFLEFVEVHNRWMKGGIGPATVKELNYTEGDLAPFYNELEKRTSILREKILN